MILPLVSLALLGVGAYLIFLAFRGEVRSVEGGAGGLLFFLGGLVLGLRELGVKLPSTAADEISGKGPSELWATVMFLGGFFLACYIAYLIYRAFEPAPKWLKKGFSYLALTSLGIFMVAPFVWMVLISLQPNKAPIPELGDILEHKIKVVDERGEPVMVKDGTGTLVQKEEIRFEPQWRNYAHVLTMEDVPVLRFFVNSLFVTVVVVVGQLFISSLAAYGFARLQFPLREPLFYLFLGALMFSGPVTQLPVYLLCRSLGWLDVGSSRVDLQACKLEYSIVSPK